MGPPIFIGGKGLQRLLPHRIRASSMGPPIFIGGKRKAIHSPAKLPNFFNGATDFHRWKVEMFQLFPGLVQNSSMGPPIFIGGKNIA